LISTIQRRLIVEFAGDASREFGESIDVEALSVDGDTQNTALPGAAQFDVV
jgi:hypothetical protein